VIEENLLRIHHDKHHAAYVKGLNSTLEKLAEARSKGDMGQIRALSRDLAFNGSGHVLHSLYWLSMKPGKSSEPGGGLRDAIERDFGSFSAFKAQFLAASKNVEASGWGLLVHEPMAGRLLILQAEKHEDLAIWGSTPLLVCDVWEHAYYLQYKNMRDDYVDSFFTVIDWPAVESRFAEAVRAG
jgi:Fe-Mn family superoxide dismutase